MLKRVYRVCIEIKSRVIFRVVFPRFTQCLRAFSANRVGFAGYLESFKGKINVSIYSIYRE